nr:MAG TPA: leucine-rich repeat protein [Caudoviricetes sp.]
MKLTIEEAQNMMKRNGGGLDLRDTPIQILPDNLTVGGWLDLRDTPIQTLPDNLTVGGGLDLRDTPIQILPDNLTVGGWLDLRDTPIQTLPDNLTVGGDLYLSGTPIQTLPDNLTVGGSLDLRDTPIQTLPDNLTVGGSLYLSDTPIFKKGAIKKANKLHDGDYAPNRYLYADGILTHIKGRRDIKEYVFYKGKIPGRNVLFDGTNYVHCETFGDGVRDLAFKAAMNRGADQYKHLTLDSCLTADEIIPMYRIITGACSQGTKKFVDSLGTLKDSYTIREVIDITSGQYGSGTFKAFFNQE